MSDHLDLRRFSRRAFLLGGLGAATVVATRAGGQTATGLGDADLAASVVPDVHLAATDGWVSMADRGTVSAAARTAMSPFWPDAMAPAPMDLYVFGFRNVTGVADADVVKERGKAQISAPQLSFDEGKEYRVKLSNLGLAVRPDLTDGHTIHWHGFVNAIPLFDGVPELSISVPIGRDFTYFYRPHDPGTYMYHCHFEDVEHVQMGMTGLLYVRPAQNGASRTFGGRTFTRFAYNDLDGSTGYDREFGMILTEVFVEGHYRDAHIQTTDWTDYKASFWALNGRTYPDTVAPAAPRTAQRGFDPLAATGRLKYQPQNALVRCNPGERVLLRLASLGYQNHAMTVDNLDLTTVAKDASLLRNLKAGAAIGSSDPGDYLYHYLHGNTVEIGPGESRDVVFTAPDFSGGTGTSGQGWDTYLLYDRNYAYASNGGDATAPGGMVTEIRVFDPAAPVPAQQNPNE